MHRVSAVAKNTKRASVLVAVAAFTTAGLVGQAQANPEAPTLALGSSGDGVWCVQRILNESYFGSFVLEEDGVYGEATRTAVLDYQMYGDPGLDDDGVVGQATGNSLYALSGNDSYCWKFLPTTY